MIKGWSASPHGLTAYLTLGSVFSRSLVSLACSWGPPDWALVHTKW